MQQGKEGAFLVLRDEVCSFAGHFLNTYCVLGSEDTVTGPLGSPSGSRTAHGAVGETHSPHAYVGKQILASLQPDPHWQSGRAPCRRRPWLRPGGGVGVNQIRGAGWGGGGQRVCGVWGVGVCPPQPHLGQEDPSCCIFTGLSGVQPPSQRPLSTDPPSPAARPSSSLVQGLSACDIPTQSRSPDTPFRFLVGLGGTPT